MKRFVLVFFLSFVSFSALAMGQLTGILTQEMLDAESEVFYVRANYTLAGATLTVPAGKVLVFTGGSLDGGEIVGTGTSIRMLQMRPAFGLDLIISGTWNVPEVHDGWFLFDESSEFISNRFINNILAFSNDASFCHIIFEEARTYYFELPYYEGGFLGEKVSYKMDNGRKRRQYSDLLTDDFSFLRIFTIPSNTKLTINNTWQMLPTEMGAYFVFWEKFKENISVEGRGKICGDVKNHLYTQPFNIDSKSYFGEWGMIFDCISCKNFSFRDITIEGAFGDCLYFASRCSEGETNEKQIARGLLMDNVKIRYGRRNGLVIAARDVVIKNCTFENCGIDEIKGTQPWAAIDFESDDFQNNDSFYCYNVQMSDCTFSNNRIDINSYIVTKPDFGEYAVTISNCSFPNAVSVNSSHWMRFVNCHFAFLKSGNNTFSMFTNSTNMLFEECTFDKIDRTRQEASILKGNKFTKCTVLNK